ncbi:superfamily I DNA/RNA helicase [Methylobacterium brachiatum]|uniref:DNA 3'-5' helicase n=1 Tax=Methylobacterium brachiatum TaxID=269660 RepID=A0AAJ1TQI9_9HYPH|nr:ATP-dependent helicase [Methylobacterium brachiatum]MCB4803722.1 UvrD-helicase domain-containing protein [Methylobacterium brachiatum]MDQ0544976.1 superfamily I DNA/RNA helicase [Methylobacterium brachiatum]
MDAWRGIRVIARRAHAEAAVRAVDETAAALVAAALEIADLEVDTLEAGTVYGPEVIGVLERGDGFIRLAGHLEADQRTIVTAHEIGHFYLHDERQSLVRSAEAGFGGQAFEIGAERVVAYSPRERRETQADVFAQEFLLPADLLRQRLVRDRQTPSQIAAEIGLPISFVTMQSIRALLLPPLPEPSAVEEPPPIIPLDPDQRAAAEWDERPLILDAGPGTGKTRTLVGRIEYLLGTGVQPWEILALTFSNQSAAEMRERIALLDEAAAAQMWIGTFHAFGLELLRLYAVQAGLRGNFDVFDEARCLGLLEDLLPHLKLRHFQNLWDPTLELRPILRAISRAKDEMVGPAEYLAAAEDALAAGGPPDVVEAAEKAVEVGGVYKVYQDALHAMGAVDFGDLVGKAAQLLTDHAGVRATVRDRYRWILVDEYQDVNAASTALLDQIADDGRRVWAVADPRQSIYRFRGAAPANAAGFAARYRDGQSRSLTTNYRSGEAVVKLFEQYGGKIAAAPKPAVVWHPHRGAVGYVDHLQADDLRSEAGAVRDQIARFASEGIPHDRQAILARTHLCLARFGRLLQEFGVPILYLGDLFERPEIRDLLSLVSLGADRDAAGLIRVAQLPEYGATRRDALLAIREAEASGEDILAVCARAELVDGLTEVGRKGLILLAGHLAGVTRGTTAWRMLADYLFEASGYLQRFVDDPGVQSQQCRVAIYQLLKFAREQAEATGGQGSRHAFLERIRRLERLDDDRAFRVVPPEADGIPAVRMMTVHAAKGLEFPAVHLPQVATRYVPGKRQSVRCPAPRGMERLGILPSDHDAEEQCLFFVALSRSRDVLSISSAKRYTAKATCNPSKFLKDLGVRLPKARVAAVIAAAAPPMEVVTIVPTEVHDARELLIWTKCPARYRYEVVDDLGDRSAASAYLAFHRCVRATLEWISDQRTEGNTITPAQARERLAQIWINRGPIDHGFEPVYRTAAETMVENAVGLLDEDGTTVDRQRRVTTAGGSISVRADRIVEKPDRTIVAQIYRTGRKSKSEHEKAIWELLGEAMGQAYPGRKVVLQAVYPATPEAADIDPDQGGAGLTEYADAITGIKAGRFPTKPSSDCPTCRFYFVCTAEDSF